MITAASVRSMWRELVAHHADAQRSKDSEQRDDGHRQLDNAEGQGEVPSRMERRKMLPATPTKMPAPRAS